MRVLLVDDETPARNRLARKLAAFPDVEIAGEAANGIEALEQIERLRPDAVFLDIDMPELDGLGVANACPEPAPRLVFVTAYDEYALRAFDANAVDYLVKPVAEARLAKTVERLRCPSTAQGLDRLLIDRQPTRVAIRSGNKYVVLDPARVSAILARDHYAAVLCDGKEYLVEEALDAVAGRFRGGEFLRVHRSAIVNLASLAELQHEGDRKYVAVLNDPLRTKVPISRDRLGEVKAKLGVLPAGKFGDLRTS